MRFLCSRPYFYPRPPRGGRHCSARSLSQTRQNFYPRPPRGGRLTNGILQTIKLINFYPRPPRGGRRHPPGQADQTKNISIHALREEGDSTAWMEQGDSEIFLSTPSARRATSGPPSSRYSATDFYPRPPRGGRRAARDKSRPASPISIHALREEGDETRRKWCKSFSKFLSTPSARRATADLLDKWDVSIDISIHALREEGDVVRDKAG